MRIGELAKKAQVSASRIRFYERNGVLPRPARGPNGYRDYPDTAEKMLRIVDDAQKLGFSLSEIREGFGEAAPRLPSEAAMVKALKAKLEHLDRHIDEARARRRRIVRMLADMGA